MDETLLNCRCCIVAAVNSADWFFVVEGHVTEYLKLTSTPDFWFGKQRKIDKPTVDRDMCILDTEYIVQHLCDFKRYIR